MEKFREAGRVTKILYLFSILISSGCSNPKHSQNESSNSGIAIKETDTAGIDILITQSSETLISDTLKALNLLKDAFISSDRVGYKNGILISGEKLTSIWANMEGGNTDSLINYFSRVFIEDSSAINFKNAFCLLTASKGYSEKTEFHKGLSYAQHAKYILDRLPSDTLLLINLNTQIGLMHAKLVDTSNASFYWNKAMLMAESVHDTLAMATVYNYKAVLSSLQGNLEDAFSYARKALQMANAKKDINATLNAGYLLSSFFVTENKADSARYYLKLNQMLSDHLKGYPHHKLSEWLVLTKISNLEGNTNRAIEHLITALQYAKASQQEQYQIPNIQHQLSELYEKQGKYKEAYYNEKTSISTFVAQHNEQEARQYNELLFKYNTIRQEKLLAESSLNIAKVKLGAKNQLIVMFIVSGLLLAIIIVLIMLINTRKNKSIIATLKGRIEGEELERARLARELHDGIVSQLSAIKLRLGKHLSISKGDHSEYEATLHYLEQCIKELRNTSHNLMPDIIMQAGLLDAIDFFCSQINATGPAKIELNITGALPEVSFEFQLSVYRILQELIYNIIKHSGASLIFVQITISIDQLYITIEDNGGHGYHANSTLTTKGIGLNNLDARLKIIKGQMEIEHTNDGSALYLDIDLQHSKNTMKHAG